MEHTALSRAELRDVRSQLERERQRFSEHDPRRHTYTAALDRVADGSYGQCVSCGDAIPFERLSAIPETLYCIACGARAA